MKRPFRMICSQKNHITITDARCRILGREEVSREIKIHQDDENTKRFLLLCMEAIMHKT